ncbi:lipocalin family protein [Ulvibacterium marinum]|uniref:Lipocalin-like domain-containing protein n=1 Tax=Ulvibacterium marinum TaxID=2419782 RepID=A0A3B0C7U3_9FLAO|nr:lipocalin family protein [Ulvibacterium marinum]RKN81370.1 hypothetical protein D7Z94_10585 [Ulvibacterium marinum]
MNTVKSILLLTVAILLGACSTDAEKDRMENTKTELILGTWKPIKFVAVHQDGTANSVETYEGCGESNRWTFTKSGRFSKEEFKANANGSCKQDMESSTMEIGSWALLENDQLSIFIAYTDGGTDLYRSEITFLDHNTIRLSYEGDSPEIDYFYGEYTRVE